MVQVPMLDGAEVEAVGILRRGQHILAPALRAAVGRLDPANVNIVSYHLGWTDRDGIPSNAGGGKALRPALALLGAAAAGAPPEVALPGAVAVELVHNFSLIHDDLIDGDTRRRRRATVWSVWGSPAAVLAGDALLALSLEILLDSGSAYAAGAARLLARTVRELIHGQVRDIAFERRRDVTVTECMEMVTGKTGSLFAGSVVIGAMLAGASDPVVAALRSYGNELGIAFQLVDDLLGIWGDPAVTGKPIYSDLRARKKSLPVTYAMTHGAANDLAAWWAAAGSPSADELRRAADFVEAAGGRAWAADEATRRITLAEQALDGVLLDTDATAQLITLARFAASRSA